MSHEASAAEVDNPKVLLIALITMASVVVIVGIVMGVVQFESFAIRDEVNSQEAASIDPLLKTQRALDKHDLSTYQWVDKAAGVVRIPVDRAVELTLHDWKARPEGTFVAPPPAAPPAPAGVAPAPAPAPKTK